MKKLYTIIILVLFTLSIFALSDQAKNTIRESLRLYEAMHSGNYTIKCITSKVTNNQHILKIEITAASNNFRGQLSFPVQKQKQVGRNTISLTAGNLFGLQYSRGITGPLSIITGIGLYNENKLFYLGIGLSWR